MIVVSEVVHPGQVHLDFNSCFVQILRKIYPTEKIVYRSEQQQSLAMRALLADPAIQYDSFPAYYDRNAYSWPKRIIGEMKAIYRSLRFGKKQEARSFVWTCLFPTGHLFLVLLLKLLGNKQPHIIVLHGELELLKNTGKRRSEKILGKLLRYAMTRSTAQVQYIVLGDSIQKNLQAHLPEPVLSRVLSILHPYDYSETPARPAETVQHPIRLATIGTQMLAKNSQFLFELAAAWQSEIEAERVSFQSIGQVLPELAPYSNALVLQMHSEGFVPQQLFEKAVEQLDFVLFFYDNQSYELCASGAVFEAIKRGVPIISIQNDYFNWLFETYGAMGFLCRDLEEMKQLISQIISGERRSEIASILVTIATFRKENSLASIASDLSEKL